MRHLFTFFLCMFLAYINKVGGQSLDARSNLAVLDMHAGLPHNFVNDIYEDTRGFIWISTYGGGLTRYDGYSFLSFTFGNRRLSLRSNSCRKVVEDRFGRLWVSFDEGTDVIDLNSYQKAEITSKVGDINKILSQPSVTVYRDTKDNIWLLTNSHIYRFSFDETGNICDINTGKYTSNTPEVHLRDINSDGSVWLSSGGRLMLFTAKKGNIVASKISSSLDIINNTYVTDMIKYRGEVWISTNIGLFRYNPSTKTVRTYDSSSFGLNGIAYVTSLAVSNDDLLLAGTLGGMFTIDVTAGTFTPWDTSVVGRHTGDFVHCILVRPGVVWIGTETVGIYRFSQQQLKINNYVHTDNPSTLSPNCVNAMYVEPDGTLWVGTVDGGLNQKEPISSEFQHFTTQNSNLVHNAVSTLAADNRRRLWIGTWGGGVDILMLDNPDEIYHLDVAENYKRLLYHVGALAYDKYNDGMWIGTNDGLFFYDFQTRTLLLPFKGCLEVRGCIGSLIDSNGLLWIGSQTGMRIIDLTQRNHKAKFQFTHRSYMFKLDQPDAKIVDKITCFCQAKDGHIWVGSNGYGIYKASRGDDGEWHFKAYSMENGLANNGVKGIGEDQNGKLWITTNNGLSVFDTQEETFTNFDQSDGLLSSCFYWNSCLVAGAKIYLGSDKGLSVIYGSTQMSDTDNRLVFTTLVVDNQIVSAESDYLDTDISVAKRINLHESDKAFSISFSALNYGNDAKGVYCYRLKGLDREWTRMRPGEHSVRYSALPSGTYTFEVKYQSAISGSEVATASIEVRVSPYFWKSWWFLLLVMICITIVATLLYKRRMAVIRERETLRLLTPIREALENSDNPEVTQERIRKILDNQKRYHENYVRIAEEDQQQEASKRRSFLDRLMMVMKEQYMNSELDGDHLADALGMSRSLLVKKMKSETGQTTSQFIKDYRLNIAREMLSHNEGIRNITEIAYRVGFNDPKYFTRCFTKKYGISPSSYVDSMTK